MTTASALSREVRDSRRRSSDTNCPAGQPRSSRARESRSIASPERGALPVTGHPGSDRARAPRAPASRTGTGMLRAPAGSAGSATERTCANASERHGAPCSGGTGRGRRSHAPARGETRGLRPPRRPPPGPCPVPPGTEAAGGPPRPRSDGGCGLRRGVRRGPRPVPPAGPRRGAGEAPRPGHRRCPRSPTRPTPRGSPREPGRRSPAGCRTGTRARVRSPAGTAGDGPPGPPPGRSSCRPGR